MSVGLAGKRQNTRVFTEDGQPRQTVVEDAEPRHPGQDCRTRRLQRRSGDGGRGGSRFARSRSRPLRQANEPGRVLCEFRVDNEETFEVAEELTVSRFNEGQKVDVTGTSKGKGYAGTVKRWNFATQDMSHGNLSPPRSRVPSASTNPRYRSSKARKWQVTWAMSV